MRAAAEKRLVKTGGLAMSLGAATSRPGETLTQTVHRADAAMYEAKTGRTRTAAGARPGVRPTA